MRLTGLHQLFPRVLEYLIDPGRSIADIATPEMDGMKITQNITFVIIYLSMFLIYVQLPIREFYTCIRLPKCLNYYYNVIQYTILCNKIFYLTI